jgi:fibronectin-binding autotransporter adhesin
LRNPSTPARSRRTLLNVGTLESRCVPAGNVVASLSGAGLLGLVGDSHDNGIILTVSAADVTVTPEATTTVTFGGVTGAAGVAVVIPGVVRSLSADLSDGFDILAIDGTADFILTGAAVINLGGGSNVLDLSTTGKLSIGKGLTVKAGDGEDLVNVRGGPGEGSQISGAARFDMGVGGAALTLGGDGTTYQELNVTGNLAFTSLAANANVIEAEYLTVGGATSVGVVGLQGVTASFANSTLHGISGTGGVCTISLDTSTVTGAVSTTSAFGGLVAAVASVVTGNVTTSGALSCTDGSVKGNISAGFVSLDGVSVVGKISIRAPGIGIGAPGFLIGGGSVTGNITVAGDTVLAVLGGGAAVTGNITFTAKTASIFFTDAAVAGNVKVNSKLTSSFSSSGVFSARNLSVSSGLQTQFYIDGASMRLDGALKVTAGIAGDIVIGNAEVTGDVTLKGCASLKAASLKADRNMTVDMTVDISAGGIGSALVLVSVGIGGDFRMTGGAERDLVLLHGVNVAGKTTIDTGAGSDQVHLLPIFDNGVIVVPAPVFAKAFTADLGDGDDVMFLEAQFNSRAIIKAGAGNDGMGQLGLSTFAPGSVFDGGSGFNQYTEDGVAQPNVTLLGWTGVAI